MNLKDAKVSWVDTYDVAGVGVVALTHSGHEDKVYTVTGPESLSCSELATIFSRILGKTITYIETSDEQLRQGMLSSGMPEPLVDALMELYEFYKMGYGAVVSLDVEQVTGKKPVAFEQFVRNSLSVLQF